MNNNFNLDENAMNNIKNMVDNGNISDAISQISPEMIQNFSKMLNNNNTDNSTINNNDNINNNSTTNSDYNSQSNNTSPNFNNIDPATIMKISSMLGKINTKDSRADLLYSLKPYLRDSKKDKIDQYVNLLNISKIADILKDDKKES